MTSKTIILSIAFSCSAAGGIATADKPGADITAKQGKDQHFCCDSVGEGKDGHSTGSGCTAISKELINSCPTGVIYCPGEWRKDDNGIVSCVG